VDGIIPSARLHKVLSKDVSYQVGHLHFPRVAAQHLLNTHFPGCQPIEEHHSSERFLQEPAQEDWNLASEVVSEEKVR
jgi:hypothetical protein